MNDPQTLDDDVFDRLMTEVHQRVRSMPENSYTTKLLRGGVPSIAAKIREESAELIEAADEANDTDNKHLIHEACDLIYHVWVLLGSKGVTVDDLRTELERREGTSGLEEKRQRGKRAAE
jgi:phosphoribosyl-ATP pyrophosphohydrolase